ncbi:MAG: hypothetical protein ILO42_02530 [Clostridia bacterium]|nr:hypothetical protein [Clostridia bacterium]
MNGRQLIFFLTAALVALAAMLCGCGREAAAPVDSTGSITGGEDAGTESASTGVTVESADRSGDYLGLVTVESADRSGDYLGLDASNGLDVIVWQMARGSYSFGLLEHSETERDWLSPELLNLRGVNASRMRQILSEYDATPESVYVIPWENPISSYIPDCFITDPGGSSENRFEEYIAAVRGMLFD